MEKKKTYKGIVYEVKVTTDIAHGWSQDITEVFIPEKHIAFNIAEGLNCFSISDSEDATASPMRYEKAMSMDEIEVPAEIVDTMVSYTAAKERLGNVRDWYEMNVGGGVYIDK